MIPTARLLAVAATDDEADDVARAGASWTVASYANPTKRAGRRPRTGSRASIRWSAT